MQSNSECQMPPTTTKHNLNNNSWTGGPMWLRRRKVGSLPRCQQQMALTEDLMLRLKEEVKLTGHKGCVNSLDWNQRGDLLASGSDDANVIVWDPFKKKKQCVINTGHQGNIFSVKFVPQTNDTQFVTGASDGMVKVSSFYQSDNLLTCNLCHSSRVKRVAVHPHEPSLIWSAAEDGYILEYDTRQPHICSAPKPNNLLTDLKAISSGLQAKCIAVNPVRSEILAVGSNDIYTRLFDRRYIKPNSRHAPCTDFAPGHLLKTKNRSNHIQTHGTTHLSFNSTGSELLASYHAEQVYLFNLHEPCQPLQTFETSIKPLLLDGPTNKLQSKKKRRMNKPNLSQHVDLAPIKTLIGEMNTNECDNSTQAGSYLSMMDLLNEYLDKVEDSIYLYKARSKGLQRRGWRGDHYQALRDCFSALAIDPMDTETIYQMSTALIGLNEHEAAMELLRFIEANREEYDDAAGYLKSSIDALTTYKTNVAIHGPNSKDQTYSRFPRFISDDFSSYLSGDSFVPFHDNKQAMKHSNSNTWSRPGLSNAIDFSKRFSGHCNMNTDIKEANFFGPSDEFIVAGSDDGAFYIWNKETTNIVKAVNADHHILNCVRPNPKTCMLATSGIETCVKFWSPIGSIDRDVKTLNTRCAQNQKFISTDPLEAMIMMLYPSRELN